MFKFLFLGEIFITVESTFGFGINDEGFTFNNFSTSLFLTTSDSLAKLSCLMPRLFKLNLISFIEDIV